MTDASKEKRAELDRLANALTEDILQASDAEILEDFKAARGDPAAYAAQMKGRFEKTRLAANKSRLQAAKAGVAAANSIPRSAKIIDMARARQALRVVLASPAAAQITLAARNENELTDADVCGMLEDLQELGLWSPDED